MAEESLCRIPPGAGRRCQENLRGLPTHLPKCGGAIEVVAFVIDHEAVGRAIDHMKLTFIAEKPPPPRIAYQEVLMAAEVPAEYFS